MAKRLPAGSTIGIATDFPPEAHKLLALNPRGTRLAVSYEKADSVGVFDPRTGREVTCFSGFRGIVGVGFISVGVLLVIASVGSYTVGFLSFVSGPALNALCEGDAQRHLTAYKPQWFCTHNVLSLGPWAG